MGAHVRDKCFENIRRFVAQRGAQFAQVVTGAFWILAKCIVDEPSGAISQSIPCAGICRDFVVNDNFLIAFQAQDGISDLAVAKARFIKETLSRHKAAQSNLRTHPSMDIIWSYGATHQQCAFRLIAKFRAICIKHNSASESLLFRDPSEQHTLAGGCKNWRCES